MSHVHSHGAHSHGAHPHDAHPHSAHTHGQSLVAGRLGRAFAVGIALNVAFVGVESVFGVMSRSTALLADAAHNLGDVLGLVMAWGASSLALRAPSRAHTYGLRRSTVLAALANAVLLLAAVGAVAWEAVGRFQAPHAPDGPTMMGVAAAGVVVNGICAMFFRKHGEHDANVRAAFLHLLADAAISAGVVLAGAVVWTTGLRWVDPVTSLVVSAVILVSTWRLLRDALHLAMDGVPKHIEIEAVRAYLEGLPGVESVHDLHVWAMSTTEVALTAHLVMPWPDCPPAFLAQLEHELQERFGIGHPTVQFEPVENNACGRGRPGVV